MQPTVARLATRSKPLLALSALILVLCAAAASSQAPTETPNTIHYQGRLLQNSADQPAVDGTVDIVFSIWTGPASDAGADEIWTEAWTGVALSNGIFSVMLGSNGSPFDLDLFSGDETLFLEMEVDGETLAPRQQLGSAPFAFIDEPQNEFQALTLSGNDLSLTDSTVDVDLSPYLDNTDVQDLSRTDDTLNLSNDATPVDLSDLSQTLSLSGDTLSISDGNSVDLGEAMEFSSLSSRVSVVEEALTRRVFVTSQAFSGDLGGLPGADAACQALADAAELDGLFRAWLSDSDISAATRIDRVGVFELVTGAPVADSWADLTDGTLRNAVSVFETGVSVSGTVNVWTGTETDGSAAADNCASWSDDAGDGQWGGATETSGNWTATGGQNCASQARLYCFEQVAIGIDDQQLTLAGNQLQLTSDNGTDIIDLSAYLDDTTVDNQVLSLSGNQLQLTSDDGTDAVSLISFLDNTDNQVLSLSGDSLRLTSDDGTDIIDLSAYLDNTDTQDLSLSGNTLSLTNGGSVSLASFKDNTDSQDIASVLQNGTNAGDRDLTNLDDVDIDQLTVDSTFECVDCIDSSDIDGDTILGNDITDRIFINWIDCNGSCADMSMRDACDVVENLRGLDFEVELMGVSCVHDVPSTAGNGFVDCDDGDEVHGDNECRAFELRTLGDIPCINGDGTDAIVTCYATDIAK